MLVVYRDTVSFYEAKTMHKIYVFESQMSNWKQEIGSVSYVGSVLV